MRLVRVLGIMFLVLLLLIVCVVAVQKLYGGEHVVTAGSSYGFAIGMSKGEVLEAYRDLGETGNIRAYGADGLYDRAGDLFDPTSLKLTPAFQASDHWMGYRHKFPVYYQEFYFSDDRLTTITTYIRLYET